MAPHHGSLRSAPEEFAGWCTPEWVVISSGHSAASSRPQYEAFERSGCHVLHTAREGAITVVVDGGNLQIESFLGGEVEFGQILTVDSE
jgi:competence protein ComEC